MVDFHVGNALYGGPFRALGRFSLHSGRDFAFLKAKTAGGSMASRCFRLGNLQTCVPCAAVSAEQGSASAAAKCDPIVSFEFALFRSSTLLGNSTRVNRYPHRLTRTPPAGIAVYTRLLAFRVQR